MDPVPNSEIGSQEPVKPQEVSTSKETLNPFQKARARFASLRRSIRDSFFKVKQEAPQGMLDPEQQELDQLSKSLDALNEQAGQALDTPQDVGTMKKVSESLGTNPGGIFKDRKTGKSFYVKRYPDRLQTSCEFIANRVYELAGAPVLKGEVIKDGDSIAYSTEFQADLQDLPSQRRQEVQSLFVSAAYLADWDAVGTGPEHPYGNLQVDSKGELKLVDHGGALLFKGLQGRKSENSLAFNDVPEINTMRSDINPLSKAVFEGISEKQIAMQASILAERLTDSAIKEIVGQSQIVDKKTADFITKLLIGRRKALEKKYSRFSDQKTEDGKSGLDQESGIQKATQKLEELKQKAKSEKGILALVGMLGDGDSIEGQQIDFVKHPGKTMVHFKTTSQMTERIRDEIIPGLAPTDVTDGRYEFFRHGSFWQTFEDSSREVTKWQDNCWVIKIDKNTSIYVSKGSIFTEDTRRKPKFDEDGIEEKDTPRESESLKRGVRIEVRGVKDPEEIAQRVNAAFQKLQIPDALTPPSQETENKYKEMRFRWQHRLENEQAWKTFREQYQRENGVDILDNLQRKEVFPGYYAIIDQKAEDQYSRDPNISLTTTLNWATRNLDQANLPSILRHGLLSSSQRLARGIGFHNNHLGDDLLSGGAESVFLRVGTGSKDKDWHMSRRDLEFTNKWIAKRVPFGDSLQLIVNPKVLSRTDWFSYERDYNGSLAHLDQRLTPDKLSLAKEVMVSRGIPVEMFEGLVVMGELHKQQILRELRSKGISEVNGVPIETFVIARAVKD